MVQVCFGRIGGGRGSRHCYVTACDCVVKQPAEAPGGGGDIRASRQSHKHVSIRSRGEVCLHAAAYAGQGMIRSKGAQHPSAVRVPCVKHPSTPSTPRQHPATPCSTVRPHTAAVRCTQPACPPFLRPVPRALWLTHPRSTAQVSGCEALACLPLQGCPQCGVQT